MPSGLKGRKPPVREVDRTGSEGRTVVPVLVYARGASEPGLRTTFADGTTVTVDWDAGTVTVKP